MAPEYALWGHLTYKADVYSFGVVALEIVAGECNMKSRSPDDFVCLLDWVRPTMHILEKRKICLLWLIQKSSLQFLEWLLQAIALKQKGNLKELIDPTLDLESKFEKKVLKVIHIALLCSNPSPGLRPAMSTVVSMLEGRSDVDELVMDRDLYDDELRFKPLRKQYNQILREGSASENRSLVRSSNRKRTGSSSTAAHDLYPYQFHSY